MITTNINDINFECQDATIFEAPQIILKLEKELSQPGNSGVGLSANQIGINKKVCIIRVDKYNLNLANPTIIDKEDLRSFDNEGCLSFPGEFLATKRFNEVFVKDLFHPAGIVCTGLVAVVVQHEIGHLYGETMHDYKITIPKDSEKCWCGSSKKYAKCHQYKKICWKT